MCPDTIISDIIMPDVDDLEFVESQLAEGCKVANIALISGGWCNAALDGAEALGYQTSRKAFDLEALTKWVDECEHGVAPERELANWFLGPPE